MLNGKITVISYLFFSIMDDIQSYTDKLRRTYRQSLGELMDVPCTTFLIPDDFILQNETHGH